MEDKLHKPGNTHHQVEDPSTQQEGTNQSPTENNLTAEHLPKTGLLPDLTKESRDSEGRDPAHFYPKPEDDAPQE